MTLSTDSSRGAIVWLTGLSAAGKSTLASGARHLLEASSINCALIDGDVLRQGICRDLGYSDADRRENIRRAGELALTTAGEGKVVFVALIAPFDAARRAVRRRCAEEGVPFGLVYVNAPIGCCEQRDPKGLYKRARAGAIAHFTGIQSPFEAPTDAEVEIRTDVEPVIGSIARVAELGRALIRQRGSAPASTCGLGTVEYVRSRDAG